MNDLFLILSQVCLYFGVNEWGTRWVANLCFPHLLLSSRVPERVWSECHLNPFLPVQTAAPPERLRVSIIALFLPCVSPWLMWPRGTPHRPSAGRQSCWCSGTWWCFSAGRASWRRPQPTFGRHPTAGWSASTRQRGVIIGENLLCLILWWLRAKLQVVGARSKLAAGAGHSRHYNRPLIGHRYVLLALTGKM